MKIQKKAVSYCVESQIDGKICYIVSDKPINQDCWVISDEFFKKNYEKVGK